MEKVWEKELLSGITLTSNFWTDVYKRKCLMLYNNKICEFNYKLLNNLLASNTKLYKWKKATTDKCRLCGSIETVSHMLYECIHIQHIWQKISVALNINIRYKTVILGIQQDNIMADSLNIIISEIARLIYISRYNGCTNLKPYITHSLEKHCMIIKNMKIQKLKIIYPSLLLFTKSLTRSLQE